MLTKNKNTIKVSASDNVNGFLVTKIKGGENVSVNLEPDNQFGERIVISANKTQGRRVISTDVDVVVDPDVYLVLVDASKNHVKVYLPVAHDFLGQLSIVCVDASNGIEVLPNQSTGNVIFDTSNSNFHAKGDSITLVSDRGESIPAVMEEDEVESQGISIFPGTWYIVGRYASQWYA
jgi:hypothetical protein